MNFRLFMSKECCVRAESFGTHVAIIVRFWIVLHSDDLIVHGLLKRLYDWWFIDQSDFVLKKRFYCRFGNCWHWFIGYKPLGRAVVWLLRWMVFCKSSLINSSFRFDLLFRWLEYRLFLLLQSFDCRAASPDVCVVKSW